MSGGGLPCLLDPNDENMKLILYSQEVRYSTVPEPPTCWSSDEEDEDKDRLLDTEEWNVFKEQELRKVGSEFQSNMSDASTYLSSPDDYPNFSDIDSLSVVTTGVSSITLASDPELRCQYDFRPVNRKTLHVDNYREQILEKIEDNSVFIITGHTGCGKSTQVPQFILERHAEQKTPVNIIVTQPRKIAAKSLAEHVCRERGWALGGLVGYHVGLDKMNKSEDTKLLYVTTGVLKMMLIGNSDMANNFTHIIIDEVHERDLDVDFLLTFLKKQMMTTTTTYKLILMSATIAFNKFQCYFAEKVDEKTVPAPCMDVGNKSDNITTNINVNVVYLENYDVDLSEFDLYNPRLHPSAIEACVLIVKSLIERERRALERKRPGAVLIFLPGIREIEIVEERLRVSMKGQEGPTIQYIQLHSSLSWEDQQRAFQEAEYGERKVILSTNIAESSITLTDIIYVIDFGLTKRLEKDYVTEYPQLQLCWASKQQMKQRKGRVGRVDKGHVFRVVPEDFFNNFDEEQLPEMVRVPISKIVLEIKLTGFGTPVEFLAITMDPPKPEDILGAVKKLKLLGALLPTVSGVDSDLDGDMTVLGEIVARLPVDVQLGKLIVLGHIFGVLDEAIIIAAGLNGKSIFSTYYQHKLKTFGSKLHWSSGSKSDFEAILKAYSTWETLTVSGENAIVNFPKKAKEFCKTYHLQERQLIEMKQLIKEIKMNLRSMGIETPVNQPESKFQVKDDLLMIIVLFGAFYPQYFFRSHNEEREKEAYRTIEKEDPMRTVYFSGLPGKQYKYGVLYKNQVINFIEGFTCKNAIEDVKFDGSKILVVFKKDSGSGSKGENEVPVAALQALKNGSLRNKLTLSLYSERNAKDMINSAAATCEGDQQIASSAEWNIKIPQLSPPDMKLKELEFLLMHVESPNSFWVVYEENIHLVEKNQAFINENLEKCKVVDRTDVKLGGIYLASFEGCFYRGLVESRNPTKVFFIDYGNRAVVEDSEVRLIPLELQSELCAPALAVECSLVGLQPHVARSTRNTWDEEMIKMMGNMMETECDMSRLCKGVIYADQSSKQGINKFIVKLTSMHMHANSGDLIELKTWLLQNSLATVVPEKLIVQEEAKKRFQFESLPDAMQKHLNDENRYRNAQVNPVDVDENQKVTNVELKGPFHTMQASVTGCTKSSSLVTVDPLSVNSVTLDWCPSAEFNVWMVSGHVSKSGISGNLIVRNTGWLPARPGLGPLIIMMFGPKIQMRVNPERTHFTGFLAGLGCKQKVKETENKKRWQPNFPQYDMEIMFDARIGLDEMIAVDAIRHSLSQLLTRGPQRVLRINQMNLLHEHREIIKRNLKLIFDKEMHCKEKEMSFNRTDYFWYGGLQNTSPDRIYSRIDAPKLRNIDELMNELKALKGDSEEMFPKDVYCPVCSELLMTPDDVKKHLKKKSHFAALCRVKKLFK